MAVTTVCPTCQGDPTDILHRDRTKGTSGVVSPAGQCPWADPKFTTVKLSVFDIEDYYDYQHGAGDCADWNGYGYLSERERAYRIAKTRGAMEAADAYVLMVANRDGWDVHKLHRWLNSKAGRWFAETVWNFGLERAIREKYLEMAWDESGE